MSHRPKNIETTLLQLQILRLIPKTHYVSIKEIHAALIESGFERSERTIQRTLVHLCEHFDIERDTRDTKFGYKWKPNARGIDLPILSAQQSLVLTLAEQQLHYLLPTNILSSMEPFFKQAHRQLSENPLSKREKEWLYEKIITTPTSQPLIPASIDDEVLHNVSEALFNNKWLNIEYQNQLGKRYNSKIMPLAIAQQGPSTYLVARYENFDDNRILALHRIKSAEVSTLTFERPQDFNLKDYVAHGHLGFGQGDMIRLTFSIGKCSGFHLTETPLSQDQQILEESDEHYRIKATVADNDMLEWWIRKFGDDIWDIEKETI